MEIINYINANYQRKISLDDISNHFYLSKTYISKYIKNKMGVNFIDYLNNVRLQHAVDDLKYTNKTILKIALDNGFPNTASFGKKFKETYNMTPSEFMVKERGKKAKPEEQPEKKKDISERVNKYLNDIELKVVENQAHSYVIVDTMYQSQKQIRANIMILYAGRAAEEVVFGPGEITTGASNDIYKASTLIADYTDKFGMDPDMGPFSTRIFNDIADGELIEKCRSVAAGLYEETRILIGKNIQSLEKIARELLKKETLTGYDIDRLLA